MKKVSHQLTENVKLLQKIVMIHDGRCLIVKRSPDAKSRPGLWDLPGGNVEWPTTHTDTTNYHIEELLREVAEETGIIINDFALEQCYFGTHYSAEDDVFSLLVGWTVQLDQQPEVKLSSEHTDYAWMKLEEGPQYDFGFAGQKGAFIRTMIDRSLGEGCGCGGGCVGCGDHGGGHCC